MKLRLNLSTTPLENNRPFLAAVGLIGTLGVLALLVLSHAAYRSWQANRDLRADIAHWQSQIESSREKQQELALYFRSSAARQILDRSAFLNSLIDERSFPWTNIFMDLEQILPPGVRVVSISPQLVNDRAQITLEVGAMSDEGKIQFLQAMEKSKKFSGLEVLQERRGDVQKESTDKVVLQLTVWCATT
jgi:Tfp pilus assembly protein PilN